MSFTNLHDLLTPEGISQLTEGGLKGIMDWLLPYLIMLVLFVVIAEIAIAAMERLADRFLPRIPIPFLSSLILTIVMPLIYLVQLVILGLFLSIFIPFLINLVQ